MATTIFIAIPCGDSVKTPFAASLINLDKGGNEVTVSFLPGSLVYDARNKLAKMAIMSGAEYTLWLDSDMVLPRDTLTKLLDSIKGRDYVSGLYFMRKPPFSPVISKSVRTNEVGNPVFETYADYPEKAVFEIVASGFGCVLMRTSVLATVFACEKNWFSPLPGMGEDLSFCTRARNSGITLFCDSSVELGHVSEMIVTSDVYRYQRSENDASENENGSTDNE